jgi:hypothetical protein
LRQQLAQSEPLGDSFNLARKLFETSQSDARQLFNFILSRLPLLQMSLEQAPTFVRLINIVARGSVYSPKPYQQLAAAGVHQPFLAFKNERSFGNAFLLMEVSVLPRRELTFN